MATGEVGTFDEKNPPTRQTFAHLKWWTELEPYVRDINDTTKFAEREWYHGGDAFLASLKTLERMHGRLEQLAKDLTTGTEPVFAGEAADAFQAQVKKVIEKSRSGVSYVIIANNFGAHVYAIGTLIMGFRREFWSIVEEGHKLRANLLTYANQKIEEIYSGVDGAANQKKADLQEADQATYQASERWILSQLRVLLINLSGNYRKEGMELKPLTVAVQDRVAAGQDSKDKKKDEDVGKRDEDNKAYERQSAKVTNPEKRTEAIEPGAGSGAGSGTGKAGPNDVPMARGQILEGQPLGGPVEDGEKNPGTAGTGRAGSGVDTGGGPAAGTGAESRGRALEDAKQAASDAIEGLKSGDPTRNEALDDAKEAADNAIEGLKGGAGLQTESSGPDVPASTAGAAGVPAPAPGAGSRLPGNASKAADDARRKALEDAKAAADDAIDDLTGGPVGAGEKPATSSADPASEEARHDALEQAKEAADRAIDELKDDSTGDPQKDAARREALEAAKEAAGKAIDELGESGAGDDASPEAARERALKEAGEAADNAIDDLSDTGDPDTREALDQAREAAEEAIRDGGNPEDPSGGHQRSDEEQAARDDALNDAKEAADEAIDDLLDEDPIDADGDGKPDADMNGDGVIDDNEAEAIRDDALTDAKNASDEAIDEKIQELKDGAGTDGLTDAERQARIDALEDARTSADEAIDELIDEGGDHSSQLSDFLTGKGDEGAGEGGEPGRGGGGGGGSGQGASPATDPRQPAPLELAPVTGQALSAEQPALQQSSAGGAGQAGNSGMPMSPPMGGGMGNQGDRDRDRNTWLVGEEGMWSDDDDEVVSSSALGRD